MKSKQRRVFKITNQTWSFASFVICGGTKEQAIEFFERKFKVKPTATTDGAQGAFIYFRDELSNLLWFSQLKPSAGIVAHEAIHATQHVLRTVGLGPMSEATEEAYAYLTQFIVREIGLRVW